MQLTKLPKEFLGKGEVSGFSFTQLQESEDSYLYKVVTEEGSIHYEIFEKSITPICIDFQNRIYSETEFKESYPKSNKFGISAKTTSNYERALEIFEKDLLKENELIFEN